MLKKLIKLNNFKSISNFNFKFLKLFSSNSKIEKLNEKNLTPIKSDDSWDTPEITKVGDIVHNLRLSKYNRRHDVDFYLRLIKNAAKEGDTEKMLSVLLHDMLIRDRVMPDRRLINILLFHLADLEGHSEAAFRILRKIKDINLEPNMVTYSLVFKNCAREVAKHDLYFNLCNKGVSLLSNEELDQIQVSPKRAFNLWKSLLDKNEFLNLSATNSLLLTLNRAGMLKESCIVLDRFLDDGNQPNDYTLSAMLEGCLTDRKNGFGLALCFYNKLVHHSRCLISPFSITTLLKVVEKCQFGNSSLVNIVIRSSSSVNQPFMVTYEATRDIVPYGPFKKSIHSGTQDYNQVIKETVNSYDINVDNFIDLTWSPSNILVYVLKSPTNMLQKKFFNYFDPQWLQSELSPSEKLACVGGIFGILNLMKQVSVTPNIHTLTSLIKCLPYHKTLYPDFDTNDLFSKVVDQVADKLRIKKDQAFKNALLKRTISLGIKVTGTPINPGNFDPYAWSIEAKHCKTANDVKNYFILLSENNVIVNKQMLFSLFTSVYSWGARLLVLFKMREMKVIPDRGMIVFIEEEIVKMRDKVKDIADDDGGKKIKEMFYKFQRQYALWLDSLKLDSINTGKRTIFVEDLPNEYKPR